MPTDPIDPTVDYRAHPERYRVGRGERGVFLVQPYKGELLPLWRFRTPDEARASAEAILGQYARYRAAGEFVGMDMARKYLQMGYTRSKRYANHRGGRKYDRHGGAELPPDPDPVKAASAEVFRAAWDEVEADPVYRRLREQHRAEHEGRRADRRRSG